MLDKKTILVTGANGLLGRHVVAALVEGQYQVHAFVRSQPDRKVDGVSYHVLDFNSDWSVDELPEQSDAIIHLAQSSKFRDFPDQAMDVFRVNIESTARLLDYGLQVGCKQFVSASSGGVYGSGSSAFGEGGPLTPSGKLGYYLGSKFCSEVLVQSYVEKMQVSVLRFFFMYGPGQKRSMLMPRLVDNIRSGRSINLQGHNGIRINPIHVSDATNAVLKVVGDEVSGVFNIAGTEVLSLRQISEIIGEKVGCPPIFDVVPTEANDLIGDIQAMTRNLCPPEVGFSDGVDDVL